MVVDPLPGPTNHVIWLGHRYKIVLPIITSRGVKYTHNDHRNHTVPTHSGPTGIRLIPQASTPKAVVMQDPYVISINRRPQHIDAMFRFMIRWLVIVNIVLGTFTVFNLVIYPKYIHEPVLYSRPANQLHPYEI